MKLPLITATVILYAMLATYLICYAGVALPLWLRS